MPNQTLSKGKNTSTKSKLIIYCADIPRSIVARIRRTSVSIRRRRSIILAAREESTASASAAVLLLVGAQLDVLRCGMTGERIVDVAVGVVLVTTPEETTAATGAVCVVVSGGGTETLLPLVVPGIEDLEEDGEEEEETACVSMRRDTGTGKGKLTFQ